MRRRLPLQQMPCVIDIPPKMARDPWVIAAPGVPACGICCFPKGSLCCLYRSTIPSPMIAVSDKVVDMAYRSIPFAINES